MTEFGPIGEEVFDRTYSRTKEDGTKETFNEVVERMVDGNLALVDPRFHGEGEREDLIKYIKAHKLVPAGRHWWVSGVPGRQFLFNCHRAGWTDKIADHVGFTFDELMKGGGVGANYSSEYLERQYRVRRKVYVWGATREADFERALHSPEMSYVVEDSREGWVDALRLLCDLSQLEGPDVELFFDCSRVRPRGAPIRGFGGTASGPGPLIDMLNEVSQLLNGYVGQKVTPLGMMHIDHAVASCVVAGNVRRSARMSMIHWNDPYVFDFLNLKKDGGHWTTNISVEVDQAFWSAYDRVDPHARAVLRAIAEGMHRNAEPGIYNSTLGSRGERGDVRCTNPCGEIALEEWENCNLGHVNLAKVESMEEAVDCGGLMARWLVRATFSDGMSYRQREVVERNRRIGVGILGFQEWLWKEHSLTFERLYMANESVKHDLVRLREEVSLEAEAYSQLLGVAFPIKTTTVAPTGTTAKISGTTEGIHPVYSRYFIRRVRYASDHPYVEVARDKGLHVEDDVASADTVVVEFPCRDSALDVVPPHALKQADEISPQQLLVVQRCVQEWWANNAVSFTVNFNPAQFGVNYIEATLAEAARHLKGTTFMPEGSYAQAPLERITREQYEAYAERFNGSSAADCSSGACPVR